MKTTFFKNIETVEELKKEFRKLAIKLHPDKEGGNEEQFKMMKAEYEKLLAFGMKREGFSAKDINSEFNFNDKLNRILDNLLRLNEITIEVVGDWVWVSGLGTKPNKEQIKSLGFKFSGKKKSWYWFEGIAESKKKRGTGIDHKAKYGVLYSQKTSSKLSLSK